MKIVLSLPIGEAFTGRLDVRIGFDNGRPTGRIRILNAQELLDVPKISEIAQESSHKK